MTPGKRLLDLTVIVVLLPILLPLGLIFAVLIRLFDGAPVFYVAERMSSPTRAFRLVKFRTMAVAAAVSNRLRQRPGCPKIDLLWRTSSRSVPAEICQAHSLGQAPGGATKGDERRARQPE